MNYFERYVKKGDKILLSFKGKFEDGTIFDSSSKDEPLKFIVGNNEVIDGIDEAVIGMKLNQAKTIFVNPDKAYGPVEKELIINLPKNKMPKDFDLKIGNKMQIPVEEGSPINVTITKISKEFIELNGNHPLAGKNLIFELKLVGFE